MTIEAHAHFDGAAEAMDLHSLTQLVQQLAAQVTSHERTINHLQHELQSAKVVSRLQLLEEDLSAVTTQVRTQARQLHSLANMPPPSPEACRGPSPSSCDSPRVGAGSSSSSSPRNPSFRPISSPHRPSMLSTATSANSHAIAAAAEAIASPGGAGAAPAAAGAAAGGPAPAAAGGGASGMSGASGVCSTPRRPSSLRVIPPSHLEAAGVGLASPAVGSSNRRRSLLIPNGAFMGSPAAGLPLVGTPRGGMNMGVAGGGGGGVTSDFSPLPGLPGLAAAAAAAAGQSALAAPGTPGGRSPAGSLLAAAAGNRASSGGGAALDVNASAAAMGVFGAMGQWNNEVRDTIATEALQTAQAVAATAAELREALGGLWGELGELRGRMGHSDRRMDTLWQLKEQDLGVTNTLHQIMQCLEQHQAQIQEGAATARQQAADIAALQEGATSLREEQGVLQQALQECSKGLARLQTRDQAAAVEMDACQQACLANVSTLKQQLQEHLASVQQQVQQQDVLLSGVQQQQDALAGRMDQQTRRDSALTQRFDSLLAKVNHVSDGLMTRQQLLVTSVADLNHQVAALSSSSSAALSKGLATLRGQLQEQVDLVRGLVLDQQQAEGGHDEAPDQKGAQRMLGRLAKQVTDLSAKVKQQHRQAPAVPPPASPAVLQLRLEAVEAAVVQGISGIVQQLMACVYLQQQQQQQQQQAVEEGGKAGAVGAATGMTNGPEQPGTRGNSSSSSRQTPRQAPAQSITPEAAAEGGPAVAAQQRAASAAAAAAGIAESHTRSRSPGRDSGAVEVVTPGRPDLQLVLLPTGAPAGVGGCAGGEAAGLPVLPLPLPLFESFTGSAFAGEPKGACVNAKAALAKKQQGQDQAREQQQQQQQGGAGPPLRAAAGVDALRSPRQFTPRSECSGSSKSSKESGLVQAAGVWQEVNAALQLLAAVLLPGYELVTSRGTGGADGAQQAGGQQDGEGAKEPAWVVGENGELQQQTGQSAEDGEGAAGAAAAAAAAAGGAAGTGQPAAMAAAVVQLQLALPLGPGQLGWSQAAGPAAALQRQQLRSRLQLAAGRPSKQAASGTGAAAVDGAKQLSPTAAGGLLAVLDGHVAAGKSLPAAGAASPAKPSMLLAHKGPSQGVEAAAAAAEATHPQ